MDVIHLNFCCQISPVYLNYIVIFSKSPTAQIEHAGQVLMHLRDAGVTVKLKGQRLLQYNELSA